jgi:hypothetical protein
MTTQTHSPLPWKTQRVSRFYGCYGHNITRNNGGVAERDVILAHIDTDSDEDRANAQLICSAVNSHTALVEALEGLVGVCELARLGNPGSVGFTQLNAARAALALARGGNKTVHYQTGRGTLCSLDNDAAIRTHTEDKSTVTCPHCIKLLSLQ